MRYRGATKRLCRLLRHTVEYVTDHWQGCLAAHQHNPALDAPQWASLQVLNTPYCDTLLLAHLRNLILSEYIYYYVCM